MRKILVLFQLIIFYSKCYAVWNSSTKIPINAFNTNTHLQFTDSLTGYYSNGILYKTSNSGKSWISIQNKLGLNHSIANISFLNSSEGVVLCNTANPYSSYVCTTNDGGNTWTVNPVILSGFNSYAVQLLAPNIIYVSLWNSTTNVSKIAKSENGGVTWVISNNLAPYSINNLSFISTDTGCAVNSYGMILKTENGGAIWNTKYTPSYPDISLLDIKFYNTKIGFSVGKQATILKTIDGGETWTLVHNYSINTCNMSDVDFNSLSIMNKDIIYIASKALLCYTYNSGLNWAYNDNVSAAAISFGYKPFVFYATGGNSDNFYKTLNGDPWKANLLDSNFLFNNGAFGFHNKVLVVGVDILSNYGVVFKSSDYGESWSKTTLYNLGGINDIQIVDSVNGFLVGDQGTVFYTNNAGNSWIPRNSGVNKRLLSLFFFNKDTGFAVGEGGVFLKTNNGGLNWNVNYLSNEDIIEIDFGSIKTGCLITSAGNYSLTADGGKTWGTMQYAGVSSITYVDSLTFFATSNSKPYILKNKKGAWSNVSGDYTSVWYLNDINFNGSFGYAVGVGGHTLKTVDKGLTWQHDDAGTASTLSTNCCSKKVISIDSNLSFAIGFNKIIKRSPNFNNWHYVSSSTLNNFYSLSFSDMNNGCIVGSNGAIFKTNDAGMSWKNMSLNTSQTFYDISYADKNNVFLCSDLGRIYKSTDGGNIWSNLSSQINSQIFGIYFKDSLNGFVVGKGGSVFNTIDGGINWNVINVNANVNLYKILFTSSTIGYIVGDSGVILKSTNFGLTWNNVSGGVGGNNSFYNLSFINDSVGIVVGSNGIALRTDNGGLTWDTIHSQSGVDFFSAQIVNQSNIFSVGSPADISISNDFGLNWKIVDVANKNVLNDIAFNSQYSGFAVGDNGTIIQYIKNMLTLDYSPVKYNLDSHPLELKVYPNPFFQNICFEVENNQESLIEVELYNSIGELVFRNILDGSKGRIVTNLGLPSNLNNGVYFIRIKLNNKILTRTLVKE